LQRACLRGEVLFDIDRQLYRPRALFAEPIDEARIRYGSPREALAHRLLGDEAGDARQSSSSGTLSKVHQLIGEGTEISGEIDDQAQQRRYAPRFTLDLEGQVKEAWCNCRTYERSGLREGPCEHMMALYIFYQRKLVRDEELRKTPEGRKLVHAE